MTEDRSFDEVVRDELLPDFRVIRTLGKGSMANVYLAKDVALDQLRAIKVMTPGQAADRTARRRFEREARSAARISHPNVTPVLRVGALSDETPFLVMEYVDGRNLEDLLEGGGALDQEEARDVIRQLAEGLAAAHDRGIIHRDLKPANVLRETSSGRVRLTDFGVAAVQDAQGSDTTRLTVAGQILGEIEYVAPEHLMGEELTELADIYSLGILAYKLLTGGNPYPGLSGAALMTAKLQSSPTPLIELLPEVDPTLASVVERCLARKPEHRPTAQEVAESLSPPPTGAKAETLPPIHETSLDLFLREIKRRRVYRVAVAYVAAAIAIIGIQEGVSGPFDVAESAQQAVIILLAVGFPVTLVLAWMFDIRQGRITRTQDTKLEAGPRLSRVLPMVALVVSLVIAATGVWWVLMRGG